MKILSIFSFIVLVALVVTAMMHCAHAQIVYPIDPETDRFTYRLDSNGDGDWDDPGETKNRSLWLHIDPTQRPETVVEDLHILIESLGIPPYDAATEKLVNPHWVYDHVAQTAIRTWDVEPLTQAELDARAEQADRQAKRVSLANAIATLRDWADQAEATTVTQGNAVTVLQTMVDRLGMFFDHFADKLESDGLSAE